MGSVPPTDPRSVDLRAPSVELFGGARLRGTSPVTLRGGRQIGLLSLLAVAEGRTVRAERIADELWDGRRVSDAALRVTVNRLRGRFQDAGAVDPVLSDPSGYRLSLEAHQVDVWHWQQLVDRAAAAHAAGRCEEVTRQLAMAERSWAGAPYAGASDLPSVALEVDRLERARTDAAMLRASAALATRDARTARQVLDVAAQRDPLREDLALLRLLAAAQEGRRDLAIAAFDHLASSLRHDVGIAPGVDALVAVDAVREGDDVTLDRLLAPFLPASRSQPVRVRTAEMGEDDTTSPSPRPLGRHAALQRGGSTLGAGGVVVVNGPTGIGRSSVGRALTSDAAGRGACVATTTCARFELGADPVLRMLRALGVSVDGASAELFDELIAPTSTTESPGELQRFALHERAARAVAAVPGPVVLFVDDLQWLDDGGARLLWHLLQTSNSVAWVLAVRDAERSAAAEWLLDSLDALSDRPVTRIELEPLEPEAASTLVERLADGAFDHDDTRAVLDAARGWPALLVECTRQRLRGAPVLGVPSVSRVVENLLRDLGDAIREVMRLVAVAGAPLEPEVLADVLARPIDRDLELLGSLQLVELHEGRWTARELVRVEVLDGLTDAHQQELHLSLGRSIVRLGHDPALGARHLLEAGPGAHAELDAVTGPALSQLMQRGSVREAGGLAIEVLERLGPNATSIDGLRTRMRMVSVLLSAGATEQALAVHDLLASKVRRLDDPVLRADALLARGEIDTGGPDGEAFVEEALELIPRLPSSAAPTRITLSCWAAHHMLSSRRSGEVDDLLDAAEQLAADQADPALRGLVLGVRYQAELNADRPPAAATAAHRRIRSWARITGDPSTRAMEVLFHVDRAGRHGGLTEHAAAVDELEVTIERMPRSDLRWSAAAARAAQLIAAGSAEDAVRAVDEAAALAERLHVGAGALFARLHQLQLLHRNQQLAVLSPLLGRVPDPDSSVGHLALDGVVAGAAGDRARQHQVAAVIRERPDRLLDLGTQWVLAAFLLGELAHAVGDPLLGRRLVDELQLHRGTGLTLLGLALLGSVDRPLGLAYASMGETGTAVAMLTAAAERDERLGYRHFALLARRQLDDVRSSSTSQV